MDRATIDEIQRAPELILAIKQSVDEDPRPGRFLLTGSADLLVIPRVADSLAGRMAIIDLLPLAIAEVNSRPARFLDGWLLPVPCRIPRTPSSGRISSRPF